MAQQLTASAGQNRRLHERLRTLQAEERADLARDLHDEVGPLLFAVNMTAATIERLAINDRKANVTYKIRYIYDAVGRMQHYVRATLERLRPMQSIGSQAAIDRLVAFWHDCRPSIGFAVCHRATRPRGLDRSSIGDTHQVLRLLAVSMGRT